MHKTLFQKKILHWYKEFGRKNLPWQEPFDPYRVWISEIMLQQTQVGTVIPFFNRFMQHFPNIHTLAKAELNAVLHLWSGLGYYARARNIYKTAKIVLQKYNGTFPSTLSALIDLPGIGVTTAGAILSFGFNKSAAILDANVKRVLSRCFGTNEKLWDLSHSLIPNTNIRAYNQALMDLGASICLSRNPNCSACPLQKHCFAYQNNKLDDFPLKKNKSPRQKKSIVFLCLENNATHLLLQKRAAKGIWGGLYGFPEFSNKNEMVAWCDTHLKTYPKPCKISIMHHLLTHLALTIKIMGVKINHAVAFKQKEYYWYKKHSRVKKGFSTPVLQLIAQWEQNENVVL